MHLTDPTPEEMKRVRELARQFGSDEAEEQRLIEIGRRVEKIMKAPPPRYNFFVWSWLRAHLLDGEG